MHVAQLASVLPSQQKQTNMLSLKLSCLQHIAMAKQHTNNNVFQLPACHATVLQCKKISCGSHDYVKK